MAKKRHLHERKRFLVPNARRGPGFREEDGEAFGYDDRPQRPLMGTMHHVDSPETVARIAEATAMCDEPECIGPALADYADLNNHFHSLRHAREVELAREIRLELTLEQRVASARARAKQQRVDVSHALHLVEKGLERARKGGRVPSEGTVRRLEAVEALLDGPIDPKLLASAA